jgi:hypothetical protein
MQRHQSSICTLGQSVNGLSRAYQGFGMGPDARAACNAHALAESLPSLGRWIRSTYVSAQHFAGGFTMRMVKSLAVALYVAIAIVAMALVLRFSGLPGLQTFSANELGVVATQSDQHQVRDQELEGRTQEILIGLSEGEHGFTVDGS